MSKKMLKRVFALFITTFMIISSVIVANVNVVKAAVPSNPLGGLNQGHTSFTLSDADLDKLMTDAAATGALYFRVGIDWDVVQPSSSSSYDWTKPDRVINAAVSKGFKIVALIGQCPRWANNNSSSDFKFYPPTNGSDYGNFCYQVAKRYMPLGVEAYELWNEANIPFFWRPSANTADYVNKILKPGYTKVKQAGTELGKPSTVITTGLAPASTGGSSIAPLDYVSGIYSNGGKGYFDGVGNHPYTYPYDPSLPNSPAPNLINCQLMYDIMNSNGDGGKKIWATEFGFPTGTNARSISESLQAEYCTKAFNKWKTFTWAGPLMWYNVWNNGTDPNDVEHNFGLLRNDWTKKPSYTAFTNAMSGGPTPTPTPTPTPPANGVDLVVTDISWSPADPVAGNAVTFSATIKNQGTVASPSNIKHGVAFYVDGTFVSWSDNYTSSISPGATITVTANSGPSGSAIWTATSDIHTINATVDDVNRILEGNESNNSYSESIVVNSEVTPTPTPTPTPIPIVDLVVTDISWSPTNPASGNAVILSAKIKNQGTIASPNGVIHGVSFYVDGTLVSWSDNYTSSMSPGATISVAANSGSGGSATWTATLGTHTIDAYVDDVNRILEGNESNNSYSKSIVVDSEATPTPTPIPIVDLVVTDISWSPANPASGNAVTYSATIKNQGTIASPNGVIHGVAFYVGGTLVSWSDNYTSSISPGATITVTANSGPGGSATWTATLGTHTIDAYVDDVNRISENNETNNSYSDSIVVTGTGDGLTGRYYDNMDFTNLKITRTDDTINFNWGTGSPGAAVGGDTFSVRWTGFVTVPTTGTYTFYVNSNDGNRLWVNGVQLTNRWTDAASEQYGTITLTAGQKYSITLEMYENLNSATCTLSWSGPSMTKRVIPQVNLYTN